MKEDFWSGFFVVSSGLIKILEDTRFWNIFAKLKGGIMTKKVEIYFRDLTPKAQSHLLKEFETTAKEENWDVFPIAEIEREMEEDQDSHML